MSNPFRAFTLFSGLALASTLIGCGDEAKKDTPPAVDAKPVSPADKGDLKEMKPADTKPVDAVKPADVKPADVKPADVKPADVKPADVKPVEPKLEAPAAAKDAAKK